MPTELKVHRSPQLHAPLPRPHRTSGTAPPLHWMDAEGRRFTLRALRPDDTALLGRLWDEDLSRASRFNRFHASLGRFTAERLRGLCLLDNARGSAFLITQLVPGGEKALAEARWAWVPQQGPGVAEWSVSVADGWHGCGLGRRLAAAVHQQARQRGVQQLRAQVLPHNTAMRALLLRTGYALRSGETFACLYDNKGVSNSVNSDANRSDNSGTDNDADTFTCALAPAARRLGPSPRPDQRPNRQPTLRHRSPLLQRLSAGLERLWLSAAGLRTGMGRFDTQNSTGATA